MLRKSLFLAIMLMLGSGVLAKAGCTPEDVQSKSQKFMDIAMRLAQKDPDKYGEVAQAMQAQLPELQKLNDLDGLCKFYDEWTGKMQE